MWLKNFIYNWLWTYKKICEAYIYTKKEDQLNWIQLSLKALKESSLWLFYVFLKGELDWWCKGDQVKSTMNNTSNRVVYLLWWYFLNPAVLLNLKNDLESEWINVHIINNRCYSKKSLWDTVKLLKNKMKLDQWKDIILFWYSAWWIIAHKIWEKNWYRSVSFWLSENPAKTMVWTLISLTREHNIKDVYIPDSGVSIVESFSLMVPNSWESKGNEIRLNNVYSHMTIWKREVTKKIVEQIVLWFENDKI